ncbi:C4b-binding protein alpha chain [Panthera uncia]|uniref:C4b-binding protein alpha chain n=1 Tax=Panthera uncia TaxID=29064 RepID=UPI0020FFB01B|nr:C4b-binding protein alpha chain [Panthera uncia]
MHPSAPLNGMHDRKKKMAAWPLPRLWKVSDPTLFQMTLVAALFATVLGGCGPPPNLFFASPINVLNQTSFNSGTILKYTCRPGYTRDPYKSQDVTCRYKSWNYDEFCVKKRCKHPGELQNGQVIVKTDILFGSRIEFVCSTGYVLVGSATSHCEIQDRGVDWSDPLPQCIIAKCDPPPAISNGKHNGGDEDFYSYGSSVTYSCDPNFSLLGKASISCTVKNKKTGVWSPSPPTCKKVTCPKPEIQNGKIILGFGPHYTYRDSMVFDCNRGFILKGSSLIHCEEDNNWDPPPPTCELNSCLGLPDIPHASWEMYNYQMPTKQGVYPIGAMLKYRCRDGYKPTSDEPTNVICQENLTWTPHIECKGEFLLFKSFCILNAQPGLVFLFFFSFFFFFTLNGGNFIFQEKLRIIIIQQNSAVLLSGGIMQVLEELRIITFPYPRLKSNGGGAPGWLSGLSVSPSRDEDPERLSTNSPLPLVETCSNIFDSQPCGPPEQPPVASEHHQQQVLFGLSCSLYLTGYMGNLLNILAIPLDPHLHSLMFRFLGNLSLLNICFPSITVLRMLDVSPAYTWRPSLHSANTFSYSTRFRSESGAAVTRTVFKESSMEAVDLHRPIPFPRNKNRTDFGIPMPMLSERLRVAALRTAENGFDDHSDSADCKMFPSVAHGFHKDVSSFFSFTTAVQYKCNEGYVLVGQSKITCRNSRWSASAPECKGLLEMTKYTLKVPSKDDQNCVSIPALCQKPEIKNGDLTVRKGQYVEPENVTVRCDDGYDMVGSPNLTCSGNGMWLPAVPKCQWVEQMGCEQVLKGKKLLECLPSPEDVKMALEVYKLSMEIEHLDKSSA